MKVSQPDKELYSAIKKADIEGIKQSLNAGIDVNYINSEGETPLLFACQCLGGETLNRVVDILIQSGADINKYGQNGFTPLYSAVVTQKLTLVQQLLEKGANPNINLFPKSQPKVVSSALDFAFYKYLKAVITEKKGYYDDFEILQKELEMSRSMMFLLTEAGARRYEREPVPEYS